MRVAFPRRRESSRREAPLLCRIIAFRNVIAHNYDNLQPERIWENVQRYLPTLHREASGPLGEA